MAATETPTKENETSQGMTQKQEDTLRNLRIARALVLRKVTDPDFNKTLQGVPRENGKYRTYYGVLFRDVFRSLADTFDSNFKQSEKNSYTKEELKEFFEHFEHTTPGFETHLDNAIEALGRGQEPQKPGEEEKGHEGEDRGDKKEKREERTEAGEGVLPEPIEEEKKEEGGEDEEAAKTPEVEIIEGKQTGPSRAQRAKDLGAKIPVGRVFRRLFSPLLTKVSSFLKKNGSVVAPSIVGAAIGGALGGPQMALLTGLFGGAFGAGVIRPMLGEDNDQSPQEQQDSSSPDGGFPQDDSQNSPEGASPQNQQQPQNSQKPQSPPPPLPQSDALAETARIAMSFPGGKVWIVVGLLLLLIVIWITMSATQTGTGSLGGASQPATPPKSGEVVQVAITKAQDNCKKEKDYCVIGNGEQIHYTLTITYTGSGVADVQVVDTLDANLSKKIEDVLVTENGTNANGVITWNLKGIEAKKPKTISLIVKPSSDSWIVNKASATVTKSGNNGGSADFDALVAGQGRNKAALGSDIDTFTTQVLQNGGSLGLTSSKTSNIRAIYSAAIDRNINPLALLTIWGVEQGFNLQDPIFGCLTKPPTSGFDGQLVCGANTVNNRMNDFTRLSTNGSYTIPGTSCTFTDPFSYAYEVYTPVCAASDGNDPARKNFVRIYNKLLGK